METLKAGFRPVWNWITHDFFKASAALFSLSLVGSALNMLCRLLLGKMLTSEQYGEMETMMQIVAYAAAPIAAMQVILAREVAHSVGKGDEKHIGDLLWAATARMAFYSLIAIGLLTLVAPLIRDYFKLNSVWPVHATGAIVCSGFVLCVAQAGLIGKLRVKRWGVTGVVGPAFRIGFSWLLIRFGFGASGALAALAGSNLLMGVAGLVFIRDLFANRARRALLLAPLAGHILPTIGIFWLISVIGGLDIFVVKRAYSSTVAGDYARVSALARLAMLFIGSIATVLFPWVSTEQAGGRKTTHLLVKAAAAGAGLAAACALFFSLFPALCLRFFYPADSLTPDMLTWMRWMTWAMIPNGLIGFLVQYYLARREYRVFAGMVPLGIAYGGLLIVFRHSIPALIATMGAGSLVIMALFALPAFRLREQETAKG
jgi:O-antigen/teichoic acid export membrane protein